MSGSGIGPETTFSPNSRATRRFLAELGIVAHTHVPGGATIYHLRHSPGAPTGHAHLQCTRCERFFDIPTDWLGPLGDRLRDELGFELDSQHAALLGTCADCRGKRVE